MGRNGASDLIVESFRGGLSVGKLTGPVRYHVRATTIEALSIATITFKFGVLSIAAELAGATTPLTNKGLGRLVTN